MIPALVKAVGQLSDPRFRGVLWRALGVSLLVFAVIWGLCWWLLDWAGAETVDWLGAESFWGEAVSWLIGLGGIAAVLVASFLVFPAVMGLAQSFFLDDAAQAVEDRHYPKLPAPREQPLTEALSDGLRLAGATIAINALALPLYIVLSFIPPLNLFVFYGINGYLLGREYFEAVAVRRMAGAEIRQFRRERRGRITASGVVIAIMLTVPGLNLFSPVVATAFMVHVFEGMRARAQAPGPARPSGYQRN